METWPKVSSDSGMSDRDLAVAGLGVDDVGELAEDVLLLERLDEGLLEFVGDEEAAFGVGADLEGVDDLRARGFGPHGVPEGLVVGLGSFASVLVGGVGEDGRVDGFGELGLDGFHPLGSLDFVGEGLELLLHVGVLGVVFGAEDAAFGAVRVKEGLHGAPELGALFGELCKIHSFYLLDDLFEHFQLVGEPADIPPGRFRDSIL